MSYSNGLNLPRLLEQESSHVPCTSFNLYAITMLNNKVNMLRINEKMN